MSLPRRRPWRKHIAKGGLSATFLLFALSGGCERGGGGPPHNGDAEVSLADARRLEVRLLEREPLSERADLTLLATKVESLAKAEGGTERAAGLFMLAARALERIWREYGQTGDGELARSLYARAAAKVTSKVACDAALREALLLGEMERNASKGYAAAFAVRKRAEAADARACEAAAAALLDRLAPFRPADELLEKEVQKLALEGVVVKARTVEGAAPRGRPSITRLDHWPSAETARVVIVMDRPVPYHVTDAPATASPDARMFVDLDGADVGEVPREVASNGIMSGVTVAPSDTGTRVAIDLRGTGFRRVFPLSDPFRLVIDFTRHKPGSGALGRTVERIAIDPGHGGNDPGATGVTGVREKEMTLDIARRAAAALSAEGLSVLLTREDDRFVSLEERTAKANGFGADLFISVHCNAAESRSRRGVETYLLDTSRDEVADRIAARENATNGAASPELATILSSMRMADQSTRSSAFAHLLQRASLASMKSEFPDVRSGGVHPATFYVLVGARMPSVLFEVGYLSNAVEEERIGSPQVRERIADGIVNAVTAYRQGRK